MTQVRHLSPAIGSSYVVVVTIGAFFGYVSSAYLTDTIGHRRHADAAGDAGLGLA